MLWMGMVIMDSQNRKDTLYQIVAFVLAKRATPVFRRPESGLRYNFEMDLFG